MQFTDLGGQSVNLASIERQTTVVLWSPSCGFCQQILNDLRALEQTRVKGARDLLVISSGSVEANLAEGFQATVLLDQEFAFGQLLGVGGTPSAAVIERGQLISDVQVGAPGVLALTGAA